MTCPESRVVEFLAGDLSTEEERRFDDHILECEACWRAIQVDRAGRLALEQLRESAPSGLHDRVTLSVGLAAEGPTASRRATRGVAAGRTRRLVIAASMLAVTSAGTLGGLLATRGATPDPVQVVAVVAMITPGSPPSATLRTGEHLVLGGQYVAVRAYMVGATEAIVATSAQPFPMPASSHLLSGSSTNAWMGTHGPISMYGVNRGVGEESMFLVAAVPMAELPQIAVRLHLI